MSSEERKKVKAQRAEKYRRNQPVIEIFKDGELITTLDDINAAISCVREFILITPKWEDTALVVKYYKRAFYNEDYKNREEKVKLNPDSKEKNVLFADNKIKYKCIRCWHETEVCGFCTKCYNIIYGMDGKESIMVKLDDLIINENFMHITKTDRAYTEAVKASIVKHGMKNPVVIDPDNKLLIGHHRYLIAKELGWEEIECKINPIKFNMLFFREGLGFNISISRIDGDLATNSVNFEDTVNVLKDFDVNENGKTMIAEFYLNIGSDIRLRDVFIPDRGRVVDDKWIEWCVKKYGRDPRCLRC